MACNCKRTVELGEAFKEPEVKVEETMSEKFVRHSLKTLYTCIMIISSIVLFPIVMVYVIYRLITKGGADITIPSSVVKYLESHVNG